MPEESTICYEVKDWAVHFENSESRRYKSLAWVPMKNKHDGKSYRRLCQHHRCVQVFCGWCLIVQVASRTPTRGLLADEDGSLTASDLAAKTGFPRFVFDLAFEVLSDPKIGWLIKHDSVPADAQQNPVNRTEQNRTDLLNDPPPPKRFKKPEQSELELYAAKIGMSVLEINKFVDHYESNGWRVGRNPMKSWEAAMRNWNKNIHVYAGKNHGGTGANGTGRNSGTSNEGSSSEYAAIKQKV